MWQINSKKSHSIYKLWFLVKIGEKTHYRCIEIQINHLLIDIKSVAELCNSFKNFFLRPPEATDGIAEEHNEQIEDTQTSVPDGDRSRP